MNGGIQSLVISVCRQALFIFPFALIFCADCEIRSADEPDYPGSIPHCGGSDGGYCSNNVRGDPEKERIQKLNIFVENYHLKFPRKYGKIEP